jgi:hypothetical protein
MANLTTSLPNGVPLKPYTAPDRAFLPLFFRAYSTPVRSASR